MTVSSVPAVYVRNYCGYCYSVLHAVRLLKLDISIKDIWADESNRAELLDSTGSSRVPVLRYTDAQGETVWLAESENIISRLNQISCELNQPD